MMTGLDSPITLVTLRQQADNTLQLRCLRVEEELYKPSLTV